MKVIKKEKMPDELKKEFINEIEVLKQLDHPNILKIYEFYEDSKNFNLITEYVNGCDLLSEINNSDSLSEFHISQIMLQIFSGLNYTHQNNLVHRDIKPENIMIEKNSQNPENFVIKIIDWGTGVKFDEKKGFLT